MSAMSSDFVFSAQSDFNLQATNKPPDPPNSSTPKISFRDKLLGPSQEIQTRPKEDMIAKKLVRIELEDGNRLLPKVFIEPKVFQELCTPWKDAIVVKLLGKTLGYNTMRDRLQKIWKLQGGFEIMDNDNGFYMVKFDLAADKEKVITGGPWLIFDHCLAISHWSPEFASQDAKVDRTIVWVRFPGLNLVYYDESFLLAMASAIGSPIKVDSNTLKVERGKFARVCVEIDLTVPVVGKIWVNGHWYKVQYEGLHLICTNCGCYGHLGRNCTTTAATVIQSPPSEKPSAASNPEDSQGPVQHIQTHSMQTYENGNSTITSPIILSRNNEGDNGKVISNNEGNKDLHGDWLLVTRKKKLPINSTPFSAKAGNNSNNRYSVLSNSSHKTKPGPHTTKYSPRPKSIAIPRASSSKQETKRRRSDDDHHDQTFDPTVDPPLIGPARKTKPAKTPHQTVTHMETLLTKLSPKQANTNENNTDPSPTIESNSTTQIPNSTTQIPNVQELDKNSNNYNISPSNNFVTNHEPNQTMPSHSDDQMKSNADRQDFIEEDMVT
jgi:hypothetical protein